MTIAYQFYVDWDGSGVMTIDEDASADLLAFRVERGFPNRQARVAQVGRCEFILRNPSNKYTPITTPNALPFRRFEFTMVVGGFGRSIAKGWIERISPRSQWGEQTCTVTCVDLTYRLQSKKVRLPVQFYQSADALIEQAIVAAGFASSKSSNSQKGISILPVTADRWENEYQQQLWDKAPKTFAGAYYEAVVADIVRSAATADWGRFFIDGNGEWRYVNRYHHCFGASTDWTVYDTPPSGSNMFVTMANQAMSVGTVYNDVKVQVSPRTIGSVLEVLGRSASGAPIQIDPLASKTITVSYRDPAGLSSQIGAYSPVPPTTANGDVYATFEASGDGASATGSITVISDLSGTSADVTITNTSSTQSVWIHRCQVRGYAIRVKERMEVRSQDTASQALYDRRELNIQSSMIANEYEARRLADFLLMQYKNPQVELPTFTANARAGDDIAAMIRDVELLNGLTVSHARAGVYSDFTVLGIRHQASVDAGHVLTLSLEPYPIYRDGAGASIVQPFLIGSPVNNSAYHMVY